MYDTAIQNGIRTEQREVTLLFADLRQFTELAASLETIPLVCELIGHVMDCLTEAVSRHQGCVVDYYGDGLLAMWNAPADQPDHPELACSAALAMLKYLPRVTADWAGAIHVDLRLGIGLHTGMVQVGNAGSARQAKYGPRGPNVHLASRVEAATKTLCQPLIATAETVKRLDEGFTSNRVCRAQLPGFQQPVDLYSVRASTSEPLLSDAWQRYDEVLQHFEQNRLQDAADLLATIERSCVEVPWEFLAEEVQRQLGRLQRRRSTDTQSDCRAGVVTLSVK